MTVTTGYQQRDERLGRNQALFREVNERVSQITQTTELSDLETYWVCEYEAIRSDPTHFVVAPGEEHVLPEIERVIRRHARYWVVEKFGEAATVTEHLDRRSP